MKPLSQEQIAAHRSVEDRGKEPKRLSRAVKGTGKTAAAVAAEIGLDPCQLSRWMNAKVRPQGVYRRMINQYFGQEIYG